MKRRCCCSITMLRVIRALSMITFVHDFVNLLIHVIIAGIRRMMSFGVVCFVVGNCASKFAKPLRPQLTVCDICARLVGPFAAMITLQPCHILRILTWPMLLAKYAADVLLVKFHRVVSRFGANKMRSTTAVSQRHIGSGCWICIIL